MSISQFLARIFQKTTETIGVQEGSRFSDEFNTLCERVDTHNEWQEKICDALINSVDTFDKTLIHDVTGLLLEDLVDSDDLTTFIEQYGIALREAGEVIRTPLGKAMTMMSRYILLISYKERDYLKRVREEYVTHCTDTRAVSVVEAIDNERDTLLNRRLDVDAAKLRYTNVESAQQMKDAEMEMKEVKTAFEEQMELVCDLLNECDRKNTEQLHLMESLCKIHLDHYKSCGEICETMYNSITEFVTMSGIRRPRQFGPRPSGLNNSELDHIIAKIVLQEKMEQGLLECNMNEVMDQAEKNQTLEYGTATIDPLVKPGCTEEVIAIWDYRTNEPDEISFKAGSKMWVSRESGDSLDNVWVMGKCKKQEGKVPVTYFKRLTDSNVLGSLF